jgi:hypothetical protein
MVVVAFLTARAAGVVTTTMTSTFRRTISAANSGNHSARPSVTPCFLLARLHGLPMALLERNEAATARQPASLGSACESSPARDGGRSNAVVATHRSVVEVEVDARHHEDRTPTHGYEQAREAAMAVFAKSWRRES